MATPKPCMNCGSDNLSYRYSVHDGEPYQTRVRCDDCGAEAPHVKGQDEWAATEKWNACERGVVVQLHPHPLDLPKPA